MKYARGRGTSKKVKELKYKKKGSLEGNIIKPTEIANCYFATPLNLLRRTKLPFNWTKPEK